MTKLFDAKEWSVMSCSAGIVWSAKKFGRFSAKTILFAEKSTSDPAMSLRTRWRATDDLRRA